MNFGCFLGKSRAMDLLIMFLMSVSLAYLSKALCIRALLYKAESTGVSSIAFCSSIFWNSLSYKTMFVLPIDSNSLAILFLRLAFNSSKIWLVVKNFPLHFPSFLTIELLRLYIISGLSLFGGDADTKCGVGASLSFFGSGDESALISAPSLYIW